MLHTAQPLPVLLAIVLLTLSTSTFGCGGEEESEQDATDVPEADCSTPGGVLQVAPLSVDLELGGTEEDVIRVNNGGTVPLCFESGAITMRPAEATLEITGMLPDTLQPGETVDVPLHILPEARGFGTVEVTITPTSALAVTVSVNLSGGGLRPEDVDSIDDLQPGESFVHLIRPDGFDLVIHSDNTGVTNDNHWIIIDPAGQELRLDFGAPTLEPGERQILGAELGGDIEASYEAVRLFEGMFQIQSLGATGFSGMLVTPDDIVLEDPVNGDLYALKAVFSNAVICLDCEVCDNGVDDDGDLDIDCNDEDCRVLPVCFGAIEDVCDDMLDNDGDGNTDCADFDCAEIPECIETACDDMLDNDNDGAIDCLDTNCKAFPGCYETSCDNGTDDDNDGFIDCFDYSCREAILERDEDFNLPPSEVARLAPCLEICDDGIDNDFDGNFDCMQHLACASHETCIPEPGCPSFEAHSGYLDALGISTYVHSGFSLLGAGNDIETSCGPEAAPDYTVHWTAPHDGIYGIRGLNFATRPVILAVLDGECGTELLCDVWTPPLGFWDPAMVLPFVSAGQEFTFVVEGFDSWTTFQIALLCDGDEDCPDDQTCQIAPARQAFEGMCWPEQCSADTCPDGKFCDGAFCRDMPAP